MATSRNVRIWLCVLLVLAATVFAIRVTGPDDLEDNSQARNVGYAIDLVDNGQWLVQRDLQDRIQSKPPLHTWLIGVLATPFGLNRLTLTLPSFLAVVGMMLLVFHIGRRRFGLVAGGTAALAMLLCPLLWRQMGMVRSDAVFSFSIALGAWAAFRAWETGKGWTWFWVCAAVSLLTKGPLGILLSGIGLMAWFWEKKGGAAPPRLRGSHLRGLLIFALLCLAWVVPALWHDGDALVTRLIRQELLGHTVVPYENHGNVAMRYLTPTINFMVRFAPFSLLTVWAVIRVMRTPAWDAGERRLERFLTCWLLAGLVIFTLPAHHRADLLLPLWPAGALLAGRAAERLVSRMGERRAIWIAAVAGVLLLAGAWTKYQPLPGRELKSAAYSQSVRQAAAAFRSSGLDAGQVENLTLPTTFQYYLGTSEKAEPAADILKDLQPGETTWVGTRGEPPDPAAFYGTLVKEAFRWPTDTGEEPVVRIFEVKWP